MIQTASYIRNTSILISSQFSEGVPKRLSSESGVVFVNLALFAGFFVAALVTFLTVVLPAAEDQGEMQSLMAALQSIPDEAEVLYQTGSTVSFVNPQDLFDVVKYGVGARYAMRAGEACSVFSPCNPSSGGDTEATGIVAAMYYLTETSRRIGTTQRRSVQVQSLDLDQSTHEEVQVNGVPIGPAPSEIQDKMDDYVAKVHGNKLGYIAVAAAYSPENPELFVAKTIVTKVVPNLLVQYEEPSNVSSLECGTNFMGVTSFVCESGYGDVDVGECPDAPEGANCCCVVNDGSCELVCATDQTDSS